MDSNQIVLQSKTTTCPTCEKVVQKRSLKVHIKTVHPKVSYTCHHCSQQFKTEHVFKKHLARHIPKEQYSYPCVECSRTFAVSSDLRQHKRKAHGQQCPNCFEVFENDAQIWEHFKMCTPKFECNTCQKRFSCQSLFEKHQETHNLARHIPCRLCTKSLKNEKLFQEHVVRVHASERNFICATCSRDYASNRDLKRHMRVVHIKPFQFECDTCDRRFKLRSSLNRHLDGCKNKKQKPHECVICKLKLKTIETLKKHQKTHLEKKFTCNTCPKKFLSQMSLNRHAKDHSTNFECSECRKTFRIKANLKKHLLIHNRPSEFACKFCNHAALSAPDLAIHIRTHTREKPYNCDTCDKQFISHKALHNHEITHQSMKYKCSQCDYKSARKVSLKRHTERVREERRNFTCTFCSASFCFPRNLKSHVRAMHKKE